MLSVSELVNLDLYHLKKTSPIIKGIMEVLWEKNEYSTGIKESIRILIENITQRNPLIYFLVRSEVDLHIAIALLGNDILRVYRPKGKVMMDFQFYNYFGRLQLIKKDTSIHSYTFMRLHNWYIARELLLICRRSKVSLPKDIIKMIFHLLK